MDNLGFNKIAAAVLATGLGYMGLQMIPHAVIHTSAPETPVYRLAIETAPTDGEADIELPFPQANWVAAMDADRGAKIFKKCMSCHNAEDGGANGTGPNLWGVVGHAAGKHAGFNYSSAITNSGITWDYETLNDFLTKPTSYLSGTAMNFVGLKKEEDRAAVIEYLRQKSSAPIDPPVPASAEASAETDGGIMEAAADAGDKAIDAAVEAGGNVVDAAGDAADTVVDAAGDALGKIKDAASDAKDAVVGEAEKKKDEQKGGH